MHNIGSPHQRVALVYPARQVWQSILAIVKRPGVEVGRRSHLDVDLLVVIERLGAEGGPFVVDTDNCWVWEVDCDNSTTRRAFIDWSCRGQYCCYQQSESCAQHFGQSIEVYML
jgi:hypothetical protein